MGIIIGIIGGVIIGIITESIVASLLVGVGIAFVFSIGYRLLNPQRLVYNNITKEAKNTIKKVLDNIKEQSYDQKYLKTCYFNIIGLDNTQLPEKYHNEINKYLTCVEGLCYLIGLNHSNFPGNSMVMRCIQFITLIDKILYDNGIKPCSLEKKIGLYKAANLHEAYLHNPQSFYTSENKEEIVLKPIENINIQKQENKKININKRSLFPPVENNPIEIYKELIKNYKSLSFELIFDKFKNIQCLNDIIINENIEKINDSSVRGEKKIFVDNNGDNYIKHFSFLPTKAIDFLLFQMILEYYSFPIWAKNIVTDNNEIIKYKELLKENQPEKYNAFIYSPYPYYYEKENVSFVQAFFSGFTNEVLFGKAVVLQGAKYEFDYNKTVLIKESDFMI